MAALSQFDPEAHKGIAASGIERVFEAKIFYLFRKRNAWNSTTVRHYTDECMHDSLQSAQNRAEQLREMGSVFMIREQPVLAFRSSTGTVLVTEINSQTPLTYWIKGSRRRGADLGLNPDYCRLDSVIVPGQRLGTFIAALSDRKVFPERLPKWSKDTFLLASSNPDLLVEDRRARLKEWKSSSVGADYYLNWTQYWSETSGRAIRRVADALAMNLVRYQPAIA
jgi:hypothetical protein